MIDSWDFSSSPGKKEHEILELRLSFRYCIDIGLVYNLSGNGRMKTSLKNLMCTFFDEDIQVIFSFIVCSQCALFCDFLVYFAEMSSDEVRELQVGCGEVSSTWLCLRDQ